MRIQVTAEDIAAGKPGEMCACPIALAVARAVPCERICVSAFGIALEQGQDLLYARLPGRADQFIKAFDDGEPVGEIEFELELRTREELDCATRET